MSVDHISDGRTLRSQRSATFIKMADDSKSRSQEDIFFTSKGGEVLGGVGEDGGSPLVVVLAAVAARKKGRSGAEVLLQVGHGHLRRWWQVHGPELRVAVSKHKTF